MKKIIAVLLTAVIGLSVLSGCQSNKAETGTGNKKLVVAMELAYPPFETKDSNGDPTGISVDFAKDLGKYLERDVEIVNTSWDGLIPSIKTGKADAVISSMTITDARKEEVDFSKPYANSLLAILANKNSDIKSIDDLNKPGKKVAVKTGSTGFIYAQKNLTNAEIIALADESACVMEVAQGKADGFLYDQLTIYRNNKANPDTTTAIFIPFQSAEYWGVAVKKGNTELVDKINEFIEQYKKDGGFDALSQKYLKEEKAAFDKLGFKWFFDLSEN